MFSQPKKHEKVEVAWGGELTVLGCKKNGRAILHRGLKELGVTEACFRLSEPQTLAVDVGANIGHMTSALAHGMKSGCVQAFEPHPDVYRLLRDNAARIGEEVPEVSVMTHECAVGAQEGTAPLHVPDRWHENTGVASLEQTTEAKDKIEVSVCRLDDEIDSPIHVLKLDVEGYEPAVLEGAKRLLNNHHIAHIIFEDHNSEDSQIMRMLNEAGYTVAGIRIRTRGPELVAPSASTRYNYIATSSEKELTKRFCSRGWESLQSPRGY